MANTKITTDALADGAITSAKLGSGAVNTQVASYLSSNSFVDTTALNSAVSTAVSNLVGSAPSTLDTLEELATSIGNSATLSSTLTSSIATKLPLAGGTLTGDLILGDSIKLELGAGTGGDLQLYHDGSHSYVTNTYASGALKLVSDDFRIENASNRNQLKTGVSGAVQLFFDDGSATGLRLGTTAAGVDVTGNIVVSGTVDGVDIATRDAVLTSTTTTANAALPKAGGTMTGQLNIDATDDLRFRFLRGGTFKGGIQVPTSTGDMIANSAVDDLAIRSQTNMLFATGGNTERMRINSSGRVGIGVVPSTIWSSSYDALQIGLGGSVYAHDGAGSNMNMAANVVYEGIAPNYYDKYLTSSTASKYAQDSGLHIWSTAASGTAGNVISWSERMRITNAGNVGIGTTTPGDKLVVAGDGARITVESEDMEVAMLGRRGSSGAALDSGYLRLRKSGVTADGIVLDTGGSSWLNGGNVGIGTTAPGKLLTLSRATEAQSEQLEFRNVGGISNGNFDGIKWSQGATGGTMLAEQRVNYYSTGVVDMSFNLRNEDNVLYLKAGGNVGIGTPSPDAWLQIEKDNSNSGNQFSVADTEGASAAIRTYTNNGDPAGLILNHYYAQAGSGNEYMRYADFVANVGNGAGTTMRFITKNAANTFSVGLAQDNNGNVGIGTTVPKASLHVEVPGNADGFAVGGKNISLTTSYQTGAQLEITLGNHQGCYVKVFITGDWSSHSAMAFLGEYFIQNGADGYAEPGMIIREVENTNGIDSVSSRIYDGGAYDSFQIQFKLNVPSGASVQTAPGTLTYQIMGQFDAIS